MPDRPTIGELCVGGDWACAHGDVETLGFIALRLAELVHEPLHCELAALAEQCRGDPTHANEAWARIKPRLQAVA